MEPPNYMQPPHLDNYRLKEELRPPILAIKHEQYDGYYDVHDNRYKKYEHDRYNLISNGQLTLPVKSEKCYLPYQNLVNHKMDMLPGAPLQPHLVYEPTTSEFLDILEISNTTTASNTFATLKNPPLPMKVPTTVAPVTNTTTPAPSSSSSSKHAHLLANSNFICEFCQKRFVKKQQLENHLKIHKNIRNFACDYCPKRFIHKQQMQNHVKTHTGEKNFHCDYCTKQFIHKQQLENHVKTHTGEKNFECETCNKKFTLKQQLQNHSKIHLGIKPFACDLCERRFTLKQQLNNHTKTHLGVKEFNCFECTKLFATKQQRAAHMKTHEKRKNNNGLAAVDGVGGGGGAVASTPTVLTTTAAAKPSFNVETTMASAPKLLPLEPLPIATTIAKNHLTTLTTMNVMMPPLPLTTSTSAAAAAAAAANLMPLTHGVLANELLLKVNESLMYKRDDHHMHHQQRV